MKKVTSAPGKAAPAKPQAQRLLEAAKAAGAKNSSFQRSMGKATLARQSRKTGKGKVR